MKKNYTNYSKPVQKQVEEPVVETKIEEVEETVDQEPFVETVSTEEEKSTIGIVSDCKKLRVRADASVEAAVICEIEEDSVVVIDMSQSNDEFYKIHTEAGAEGYCMRKFIAITS